MCKTTKLERLKSKTPAIWAAIKDLSAWLFASFLLPLVQLFIIKFSVRPAIVDENVYNILFVTIASFLTGVFFVTSFWKQNRTLVRMMLVISYLIAFGLFVLSLVQVLFGVTIFKIGFYRWGVYISLVLAVMVGFYSKYDEKLVVPREIAEQGKNKTQSEINGKEIKL